MSELSTIPIADIDVGRRLRPLDEEQVAAIQSSVLDIGLLNPITVYRLKLLRGGAVVDGYGLIAGAHRLEVFRRTGWTEIPAHIVDLTDLERQLAECDENLCGTKLTPSERAMFTKRRKDAYEALHPEAKAQVRQAYIKHDANANLAAAFTADTAQRTGQSERVVQRDAERGEKVCDKAVDLLRGTALDTGTYLDRIKNLMPNEQVTAVKRDLAWEKKKAAQPKQARNVERGGIAGRYEEAQHSSVGSFARFQKLLDQIEAIPIADLIQDAGRQRALLNQRSSSLIERLAEIVEGRA